jgi:nucleolin
VDPATLAALQQLQQIQQLTGQQPTGSAASIGLSGLGGGGFAGVPTATPSLYGAPAAPQQPAAPNLLQFLQPQQQSQQPQQQSVQHLLQQQMQQSTMQQQQQPLPGLQGLQGLLPGLAGSIQAQPPHQQPSSVPSNTLHPHQHHQQQQQQSGSQSASVAVSNMQFASPDQIKPVSPRPPGCKSVFVGNVHDSVAEPTILQIFAGCGPIERVKWLSDRSTGRFKGSGFIEFRDEASAVKAVNFNGAILAGQVLRVDYAGDRPVFDSQHPPHQQQLGAPSIGGQYDTQPTTSSSGSNATSALSAGLASLLGSGALSSLMTGNQQGIHMQNGSHTGAFNPYQ